MDAFTIQKHVADWLNAAQIPRLDHVYEDIPEAFGEDLGATGSGNTRCVATVFIDDDDDGRRSGPAADPQIGRTVGMGVRQIECVVKLSVVHWTAEDNWIEAARQLKQDVCEGITKVIRSDPSLGTWGMPVPLFKGCGEGKFGVKRHYDDPYTDPADGGRKQWAVIEFHACVYEAG